jgi:hypothetical protein
MFLDGGVPLRREGTSIYLGHCGNHLVYMIFTLPKTISIHPEGRKKVMGLE